MTLRLLLSAVRTLVVAALLVATRVHAQPAPPDPPEKVKARALLKEGVRLLNAGQLAPALRKFEDAYTAFPSAKILVNIGTAQSGLGRPADAANTYQRYLDSAGDDAAQLPAVRAALADLDAKLGRLAVKLRGPASSASEVRVASGAWMSLSASGLVRVAPGRFDLQARSAAGARDSGASGTIAAGEQKEVAVDLTPPESQRPGASAIERGERSAAPEVPPGATPATPASSIDAAPVPAAVAAPPSPGAAVHLSVPALRASRWTPLRYGAVAAGAAGVAGIGAMAVLALRARSMWSDAQADTDSKLASRAASQANLATGAGVAGVAALAAGTVLWFVGAPHDRESATVTAIVDHTHAGLAVSGRF